MSDLFPVTIAEQIDEVKRELQQRQRVYPRLIGAGKMTQVAADRNVRRMEAVLATLERIANG